MFLTHALRAILRTAVATGDALWKYVSLLLSGTPPTQTFIADASANASVLTLNGDVRPSNLNPYVEGYYSNYFDGSGDNLSIASSTAFGFGTGDFTIEFWAYSTSTSRQDWVDISDGTNRVLLYYSGSAVTFYGNGVNAITGSALTTNTWVHYALVKSSGSTKLYVNGTQAGSTYSTNQNYGTTAAVSIGKDTFGSTYITGYLSNSRIVKGTAVYTTNFTPSTAPLTPIAGTTLLTCQSNRFIDNSANNFAITRTGDVAVRGFVPFTPPTTVNVNTLYSTYFDGTGDYLVVSNNANLALGADNFTIEMWVMLTSSSGTLANYSNGQSATSNFGWEYYQTSATSIQFSVMQGSSQYISSATGLVANAWNHVAGVRNGTSLKIYINGVAGATVGNLTGVTVSDPANASVNICSYLNGSYYTAGYISNFRIVKGTALYTTNFTPPTAPLTAISGTSLLTCQNATLRDNSTNALAITSYGQAQPDAISPFTQVTTPVTATYLGSGYFDGTGDTINLPASAALLGSGSYTVEFWVNLPNAPSGGAFFTCFAYGSSGAVLRCFLLNDAVTKLGIWIGVTNVVLYPTSAMVGQWAHIALVRSGTTLTAYINGVSVATASDATNYNTGQLYIASQAATNFLTGYISNFRIVVGTAVYTANFAPPATPLTAVANTSLLTLQTDQPAANKQFVDNSGNNLVITQAGNATQGAFSPYGSNWSNYFDGTGDYLTVPSNAAFQLGTGDFTFECWFNPTSLASAAINTLFNIGTYSTGLFIRCASIIEIYINNVQRLALSSTGILSTNTWQHVALVRSGSTCKVYVNGVSVATFTDASSISPTTATVTLGMSAHSATETLTGYMSNVRLVKGTAVYTANFTPPTAPLTAIANTSLLTCQSPSLVDNSTNSFAITRNGDVSVQRFSPFSPVIQAPVSYSTYFDGSGDYITTASNGSCAFGSGDFTIEFWLYANSVGATDQGLIDMRPTSTNGYYPYLYMYSGQITYWLNATAVISSASGAITAGSWYHVALTRSGSSNKLFINGVQSGSTFTSTTALLCDNARPVFGSAGTSLGGSPLNGYISNARIVKGTALYTANFTPPTAPLTAIANTSLLTCQSATIVDNSSNAFAITVTGDARARSQNPFGFTNTTTDTAYTPALYGGSAYFDGTGDYLNTPSLISASGDFTLECWFNTTIAVSGFRMLCGGNIDASASNYLGINASGVEAQFGSGSATVVTAAYTFVPNTWYHVAMTRSGTTIRIFVNGVSLTTSQGSQAGTFAIRYVAIGYNGITYTGYMADLRFVIGQALYTGGFVPPIAPLQAVKNTTLLLNMDKSGITDSSRCIDLETVGDAKIRYESPYSGSYYSNYFDGSGDYLSAPSNAVFGMSTDDFTWEAWVYPTQIANGSGIISIGSVELYIRNSAGGNTVAYYDGSTVVVTSASAVTANQWSHVALVRSSGNLKIYLNGVGGTGVSYSSSVGSNSTCYIGVYSNLSSDIFTGYISNLRILKGTAVYTANFTPSTTPLTAVAGTSLLTCQSKSFVDNSSNNFTITRNGDVAVRSLNPFQANIANSSMYFDGTGDYLDMPLSQNFSQKGAWTLEMWVYPTASNNCYIYSQVTTNFLQIGIDSSRIIYIDRSGVGNLITGTTSLALNAWSFIALVSDGTNMKLFVNGVQQGSTAAVGAQADSATVTRIGAYQATGTLAYQGYVADLRITKAARYTATFTPPTAPLPTA